MFIDNKVCRPLLQLLNHPEPSMCCLAVYRGCQREQLIIVTTFNLCLTCGNEPVFSKLSRKVAGFLRPTCQTLYCSQRHQSKRHTLAYRVAQAYQCTRWVASHVCRERTICSGIARNVALCTVLQAIHAARPVVHIVGQRDHTGFPYTMGWWILVHMMHILRRPRL